MDPVERRPPQKPLARILVHAPDTRVRDWVEREFAGRNYDVRFAMTPREVIRVLVEDPPPRPQVLVLDFDALSPSDVLGLSTIRDRGWFGAIVALGDVPSGVATGFNVAVAIARPLEEGLLRDAVAEIGVGRPTTRMSVIRK